MPTLKLEEDLEMPILGFGTWHMLFFKAKKNVENAIKVGFRHIDTAPVYFNLPFVGMGIRKSGVPRDQLFITTKLWRDSVAKNKVIPACKNSLWQLGLDHVDLYLLHWPVSGTPAEDTLSEMFKLKDMGLVRSVGVSNHTVKHLEYLKKMGFKPAVNQVEFHPSLYQKELWEYCKLNGIALTAHSPVAQGQDLRLPLIKELAEKYQRSSAQVVFNWMISKGVAVIPSTDNVEHMQDNLKATEWRLEEADLTRIDGLNTNNRLINPGYAEF